MDNCEDIIDSREVIDRIAELEADGERDEEDDAELANLLALQSEAEGYVSDWRYGAALIRDGYFTEYAQTLADDLGAVPGGLSWPLTFIDWDAAAEALKMDYTSVDFDGVTYWVR